MAAVFSQFMLSSFYSYILKYPLMQGGSFNSDLSSPIRENSSTDGVLDDLQSRIKRLERWNTINMVIVMHLLAFRSTLLTSV